MARAEVLAIFLLKILTRGYFSVSISRMLKIKLQRVGRKHDPSFRVVLVESARGPKSGSYIEILGSYDARTNKPVIKSDRVKHWISNGAQPTDTVHNLLVSQKIIEGKAKDVSSKKNVGKKEAEAKIKAEKVKEEKNKAEDEKKSEAVTVSPDANGETPSIEESSADKTSAEDKPVENKEAESSVISKEVKPDTLAKSEETPAA